MTTAVTTYRIVRGDQASRIAAFIGLALAAAMILAPWWADRAEVRLLTEFLYVLALAQMWNLLAGFGGLLSVGQQGFIGVGGYVLVIFGLKLGVDPFLTIPLAGVICGALAAASAPLLFRLRGAHFAVGTWVIAEIFAILAANMSWVGGGSGLSITQTVAGIPAWRRDALTLWSAAAVGLGAVLGVYALLRSRWGLALTAVRDSEPAAASLGVDVRRVKWAVFIASACGCGMIGALIFITKLRISPGAAFSIDWTAAMIFIVVIGGVGSIEGPILGALIYFILRELLADYGAWYMIVLGLTAVAVMLKAPRGLWGLIARRFDVQLFPIQRRVITPAPKPQAPSPER